MVGYELTIKDGKLFYDGEFDLNLHRHRELIDNLNGYKYSTQWYWYRQITQQFNHGTGFYAHTYITETPYFKERWYLFRFIHHHWSSW